MAPALLSPEAGQDQHVQNTKLTTSHVDARSNGLEPAGPVSGDERQRQKLYWAEHTPTQPTVETMMLDSSARVIDEHERPEVLNLLGSVAGKRVLELGAGIGRFTGELCKAGAVQVLAVDFMEASIEENRRLHGHLYPQLSLAVEDATQLQLPDESYDVIFTNWLLMYLSDDEVLSLAQRMLKWLAPGGVLFFRESCFKQSGDKPRKDNPTHYRNPREYFAMFDSVSCGLPANIHSTNGTNPKYVFELLFSKCVDTYVTLKHNQNQICWRWRKVEGTGTCPHSLRHFLDGDQYSTSGLKQYEAIYGRGFISCGGEAAARSLLPLLKLKPQDKVLDVGCGTGGAAALMSAEYGAAVHGMDLSVNCLLTCLDRASLKGCSIVYEVADITKRQLEECSFAAVHCRDVLLHVKDKPALLNRFFHWMQPGGRLLITDYAVSQQGSQQGSPDLQGQMQDYLSSRQYSLYNVQEYTAALRSAGFDDVHVEDRTHELITYLEQELSRLQAQQQEFSQEHGQDAYAAAVASWEGKLARAREGIQRWVLATACKPTANGHISNGNGNPQH